MAVINVDDIYVLDETGAQVDKVTGLFTKDEDTTSGEKAFAQLNIGTAGSNRNLLDNPWFTVNQRGTTQTSSGNSYIADRWVVSGNTYTWTYARAALSVTNASGSIAYLFQKLPSEVYADINGKTVTYSVMINGTVYSVPFTWDTTKRNAAITIDGLTGIMFWYGDQNQPCLRITVGGTWTVNAIKLELGSVSTLANDAPPDYGTELIKCRGYFERIHSLGSSEIVGMGMGVSASSVRIGIPSLICHTIQSVTYSGGGLLLEGGGNYRTLTSIGKLNATPKNGFLTVTCGSSDAITLYQTYALVGTAAGGYIDISADL